MRLISKFNGAEPTEEYGFSPHDLSALKVAQGTKQSQKTLKLLHGKYWLQCNCTKHDNNAPTLTIRANPNGTYSLVNMIGRAEHRNDCPLSYEKLAGHLRLNTSEPFNIIDPANRRSLLLLINMITERANLNIISSPPTYNNNKECTSTIGTKDITVKGRNLEPLFNFGFRTFFALRDKPSHEGDFIWEVVDEIKDDKGTVELKDAITGKIQFSLFRNITDIYIKEDEYPCKTGAFLVLAYVGKNSKTKDKVTIAPISAVILPTVSKNCWLTPTHKHFRTMLQSLINAQTWYRKNKDLPIAITTPVRPLSTLNGVCKPDFIVKSMRRIHLINLLPDNDKTLIDDQLKSIDIMRELGPVTEINFEGVDNVNNHIFEVNKVVISSLDTTNVRKL
jgi:hypothetical protein